MNIVTIADCPAYTAEDNAVAKEFISPSACKLKNLSIAHITIPAGVKIKKHYHVESEEVYQVISGEGIMHINGKESLLRSGQAIAIEIGQWHTIDNQSDKPLEMIVTCSPPWSFEDQVFESE
ncbi:cupin domain-containing protein [Puniceicoccaceae bacterium K14]|nr:cupin domain-containing protein [Puniceicoccaceae bacterium K14]